MTYILCIYILLFTSTAFAETRVYTDYNPVRVFTAIEGDTDLEAEKAGLKGAFKVIDPAILPLDRTERDAWKFSKGEIKVDPVLLAEHNKQKNDKQTAITKLKTAAGLSDDELALLGLGA